MKLRKTSLHAHFKADWASEATRTASIESVNCLVRYGGHFAQKVQICAGDLHLYALGPLGVIFRVWDIPGHMEADFPVHPPQNRSPSPLIPARTRNAAGLVPDSDQLPNLETKMGQPSLPISRRTGPTVRFYPPLG